MYDSSWTTPHDQEPMVDVFRRDVLAGLRRQPKQLGSKYFYDARGSRLFERICQLDEYYLTRTELAIMRRSALEMAQQIGSGVRLVEFGSGSSVKSRVLLDCLEDPVAYVPVDISGAHLQESAGELSAAYPLLRVLPVCADFTAEFTLPATAQATHTVVYFPGSTIGNLQYDGALRLLRRIARLCDGDRDRDREGEGGLLIGIDLQKDAQTLEAAYNDRQGVTAEFNLNLLRRINRELGADFAEDQFDHVAYYNTQFGRIEMHLRSRCQQTVRLNGESFSLLAGETICTEYSHKYTVAGFKQLLSEAGLLLRRSWIDPRGYFAVVYAGRQECQPKACDSDGG